MRRLLTSVALGLSILFSFAGPALAHTDVVDTFPAPGATVAVFPDRFSVTFADAVDPVFVSMELNSGTLEALGSVAVVLDRSTSTPATEIVFVPAAGETLPTSGSFVAHWKYYGLDGHSMDGYIPITVGATPAVADASGPTPLNTQTPIVSVLWPALRTAGRLFAFLASAMIVGVWFWKRTRTVEALADALSPTWNLAASTATVFLQASTALVVLSSLMLARQAGATSVEVLLKVLTSGSVFPWLVALCVSALSIRIRPAGVLAALAVAYAAASSSHAVEQRLSFFSISFATLHLVALFVWVGPLLALAWLRAAQSGLRAHPGLPLLLRDGLEKFSLWAGTAVALIVISGVRQTVLIADGWPGGQWGFWFWSKMIMAALTVVPFAVFHHLALRRANSGDGAMPILRQTVWLESAGVVAVMVCAAVMAGMNP